MYCPEMPVHQGFQANSDDNECARTRETSPENTFIIAQTECSGSEMQKNIHAIDRRNCAGGIFMPFFQSSTAGRLSSPLTKTAPCVQHLNVTLLSTPAQVAYVHWSSRWQRWLSSQGFSGNRLAVCPSCPKPSRTKSKSATFFSVSA